MCNINLEVVRNNVSKSVFDSVPVVERFQWDHANVMLYYNVISVNDDKIFCRQLTT